MAGEVIARANATHSVVVLAKARTHNPKCWRFVKAGAPAGPTTSACGYGSRRSPGRRGEGFVPLISDLVFKQRGRHCERSEAIQGYVCDSGLLRFARNDGAGRDTIPHSRGTKCPSCWKQVTLIDERGRRECRVRVAPEAACAKRKHRR